MTPNLAGMAEAAKKERERYFVGAGFHSDAQAWIEARGQRAALLWLASVFPHSAFEAAAEAMFGKSGQNEIDIAVDGINAALRAVLEEG